ncbi:MAG: hypothetical protein H0X04_06305 [Chthoniobacterales bacterium]|nr:hypothetical protein [Chthoniobacterales bacterium]
MNDPIRVVPVRTYRVPRYPSHLDPDPLSHQSHQSHQAHQAPPYPFAKGLIAAVAAGGLASGWQACAAEEGDDGNPLSLAHSGLPHHTSPFGTGAPDYLEANMVRKTIRRLMEEAGYQLQEGVDYDRDGVRTRLDGYDAQKKVGFVFAGYNNMDRDALLSWSDESEHLDHYSQQLLKPDAEPKLPADLREWLTAARAEPDKDLRQERLATAIELHQAIENKGQAYWSRLDAEEARALKEAALAPSGGGRLERMAAILKAERVRRLSLSEAKQLEERAVRNREFIAVISAFDQRFLYHDETSMEEWADIEKLPEAEREEATRRLKELSARSAGESREGGAGISGVGEDAGVAVSGNATGISTPLSTGQAPASHHFLAAAFVFGSLDYSVGKKAAVGGRAPSDSR